MKFVCDNCGTQYLISDEKVGPKGAKIRCKRCGNIILLRPGDAEEEQPQEPSVPTERHQAPDMEDDGRDRDELGEAFDQLLKAGLDGGDDDEDEGEQQATEIFNIEELHRLREGDRESEEQEKIDQVFSQAESTDVVRSQPGEDREEWYVAVGDEQVGPLALPDVERKWESGEVGPDNLAWHPGMGDWTAIKDIPRLRYLLGAKTQQQAVDDNPIAGQPSAAAAEDEWAPGGGSSLSSLVEEEMQAVQSVGVKAESEPEKPKEEAPGLDLGEEPEEGEEGEIPPWEREDVVSGEVARPSDSFFDSTLDQSAPGAAEDTGSSRVDRELARPAYLTSQTKRKSPTKMIVITLVILIVLGGGAVGVYLATQKTSEEKSPEMTPIERPEKAGKDVQAGKDKPKPDERSTKAANTSETKKEPAGTSKKPEGQKDVLVVGKAGTGSDAIVERPVEKPEAAKKPGRDRPKPTKRRKRKVATVAKPVERRPPTPVPKPDKPKDSQKPASTASSGGLPKTLPKAEIAKTMKKYVRAMRGCVKQQQQRDPTVSGTMLVSFTIGRNGKVDLVRILSAEHKGTYVAGCITYIIKSIKFGKFTGDPITVPRVPLRLGG